MNAHNKQKYFWRGDQNKKVYFLYTVLTARGHAVYHSLGFATTQAKMKQHNLKSKMSVVMLMYVS